MFTERHFVQFLEGPDGAIETLLDRLPGDSRHARLRMLHTGPAHERPAML